MSKKFLDKLSDLEGAVNEITDPFENVLRTSSPCVNYLFGNTQGLPFGYTTILYGPQEGGKSVLSKMFIGGLHQSDPEAIALLYDAEFRAPVQLTARDYAKFGVDNKRLKVIQNNSAEIFNQIAHKVNALCQNGAPIKLIVIDSISSVQGRLTEKKSDVNQMTFGDHAQTIQIGLKMILPVIRKHNIALILIAQARAEMDEWEAKRNGVPYKMAGSYGLKHMAEYFISVQAHKTKEARADILGNSFINDKVEDLDGHGENMAFKSKVTMTKSSLGPVGRRGYFTFSRSDGPINRWEEIAGLALGYNLIDHPDGSTKYGYNGQNWVGAPNYYKAVRDNEALQKDLERKLQDYDSRGILGKVDGQGSPLTKEKVKKLKDAEDGATGLLDSLDEDLPL